MALIISNRKLWKHMKIVQSFVDSAVLIKGVTQTNKNETKKVMDFLYKQKPIEEQGEKK